MEEKGCARLGLRDESEGAVRRVNERRGGIAADGEGERWVSTVEKGRMLIGSGNDGDRVVTES